MNKLLIATNNQGKIKELHELLDDMGIDLVTPAQIGLELDVIEDGFTYAENAAKKAISFAEQSALISLADDSGLEVDALNGEPGLYSARYGSTDGKKLSDAGRRAFLITKLQGKPQPWTARFHATIAIAIPPGHVTLSTATPPRLFGRLAPMGSRPERGAGEGLGQSHATHQSENVHMVQGWCEGQIIPEERGTGGFGYDPIFLLPELGRTMAELSPDEKNRLSHRARAVMNAKPTLHQLFDS